MSLDLTLQLNICPGDISYAEEIGRRLAACHREICAERILVLDRCRPQSSQYLHAETLFPDERYAANCSRITQIAEGLVSDGVFDRLITLDPGCPLIRQLSEKYLAGYVRLTHDCFGHASMAYYAGFEMAETRYLVHYDSDILLYQEAGFQWPEAGRRALESDERLLAVSPRISPPADNGIRGTHPAIPYSQGGGWLDSWVIEPHSQGWQSDWFSTRCFMVDRTRLHAELPLVGRSTFGRFGKLSMTGRRLQHWALGPAFRRGLQMPKQNGAGGLMNKIIQSARFRFVPVYPDPPEVLLHEVAGAAGARCLYLEDSRAWFIHPDTKPASFIHSMSQIHASVARCEVPVEQLGHCGVQHEAWQRYCAGQTVSAK